MKVTKLAAIALLQALDYPSAAKWELEKLAKKLNGLKDLLKEEDRKTVLKDDEDNRKLLLKILEAESIEVTDKSEGKSKKSDKSEASAKTDKSEASAKTDKSEASAKTDKSEASAKTDKSEAKSEKKAKKEKKPKGPGVVQTICEILIASSKSSPTSVDEIWQQLKKKFPDRDHDGMRNTIRGIISARKNPEKDQLSSAKFAEGYTTRMTDDKAKVWFVRIKH